MRPDDFVGERSASTAVIARPLAPLACPEPRRVSGRRRCLSFFYRRASNAPRPTARNTAKCDTNRRLNPSRS